MPKSNLVYETDNPDDPVPLIDSDNYLTATVTIDSATTLQVDTSSAILEVGADYEPDVWAFTFVSGVEYSDTGKLITIEVTIDNPHMIQNLVDDWKFEIGA